MLMLIIVMHRGARRIFHGRDPVQRGPPSYRAFVISFAIHRHVIPTYRLHWSPVIFSLLTAEGHH